MNLLRSNLAHMAAGFLLMGAWGWYANRAHPWPAPALAALVQGVATAVTTGVLKRVVDAISARSHGVQQLVLPVLAAWAVSISALLVFHLLGGTPELWRTIALPNLVATLYAASYAAAIRSR